MLHTGVGMERQGILGSTTSDESLVLLARAGDRAAFAELWERHARSGLRVARQFTSSLDADDLVSEAYTRIYQRVLDGGGPDGAFRPYLYTTIRNLASRWGGSNQDVQVEDIDAFEDDSIPDDPSAVALDRSLTVRAFRTLPERWQAVLWYTEVEGMDPHEVAPILGGTANSIAALSYRAREGLRRAWLQAHVSADGATNDCRWTIQRLGENARRSLTDREQARVDAHLLGCAKCSIIAEEVEEIGSRLALVMLPLLLGATAGGTLLASLGAPAGASAAQLAVPSMPPAFDALAVAGAGVPTVAAGLGAGSTFATPVLVGSLALVIAVGGGVATTLQPPASPIDDRTSLSQPRDEPVPDAASGAETVAPGGDAPVAALGDATGGVDDLVRDITDPISALIPELPIGPVPDHVAPEGLVGAVVDLDLNGKGMPGAVVSAQVAGQVYTTVVAKDGTWAVRLTALPEGIGPVTLKQNLRILGIVVPIDIPLTLLSDTLGITVELLN